MSPYAFLLSFIQGAAATPFIVPFAIIVATFILEDAAMVITGVLAANGDVGIVTGIVSLFIGIALGDFGLYGIGKLAITHPTVRRWVEHRKVAPFKDWLDDELFTVVTVTRFLPGMRLPTYLACGFFSLPFKRFARAVLIGVAFWVPLLFGAAYIFGYYTLDWLGVWRWPIVFVALGILVLVGRRYWHKATEESQQKHGIEH